MIFDVGTFTYTLLTTDSTISALVPSTSIFSSWPESLVTFPSIIFSDDQRDILYKDNLPDGSFATVKIDVFVKDDTPMPISLAISNAFMAKYWSCEYNDLVPDPDTSVRHRVMRFSRPLTADDI